MQAAEGTYHVIKDPRSFNKYAQQDVITGLMNPLLGAYLESWSGGRSMKDTLERSVAAIRTAKELQHPGSGGVYPTSRTESIGHFMIGGLFPRKADQQAITRSLQRENAQNPMALIPEQVKQFEKITKQKVPEQLISQYKADLEMIDELRNFQHGYASSHGSSGFRNLPPQNKLEAAIQWIEKYSHLPDDQVAEIKQEASGPMPDAQANELANAIFAMSGIGTIKRTWDEMMRNARGLQTTRKRG
jgi:hypothetical protein